MEIRYQQGSISPEEVIRFLLMTDQFHRVCLEIIKNKEVVRKAKELGITVSDEELQEFADNYRLAHGLCTRNEMLYFLKNACMSEDDFEKFCESSLLTAKLKVHLVNARRIEEYFINNRAEFDQARISVIIVREESLANEIMVQITEEGENFNKLARQHSIDNATNYSGGYAGFITRKMLSAGIAAKVLTASPGDVLGPVRCQDLFQLILVEDVIKANLNDSVSELIMERIFGEWLSQFLKEGLSIVP